MENLGLIGFGEAGYYLTSDLSRDSLNVLAYDPAALSPGPQQKKIAAHAAENRVILLPSLDALIEGSDIIFCLTSANSALPIAEQTIPKLRAHQIYCDLNSTSPATKEQIAGRFASCEGSFVEAAIMASVPANRTAVPIYVCGKMGQSVADRLNPAGMHIKFLNETYGAASAIKMLKSVLFKGFIALLTETVFATDRYGVTEEVLQALKHMLMTEMTYEQCCNYFVETMAVHSRRLSSEMEEVLKTLEGMGENSIMTQATLAKMRWITEQGYSEAFPQRPNGYEGVLEYKRKLDAQRGML